MRHPNTGHRSTPRPRTRPPTGISQNQGAADTFSALSDIQDAFSGSPGASNRASQLLREAQREIERQQSLGKPGCRMRCSICVTYWTTISGWSPVKVFVGCHTTQMSFPDPLPASWGEGMICSTSSFPGRPDPYSCPKDCP